MSTRGALGFRLGGKDYIAYNHFDSYPDGLGFDVIEFVNRVNLEDGWTRLKQNVSQLRTASKGEVSRDMEGVAMLHSVYDEALKCFPNASDFMKDGLFNEYSYIIDLDEMMLDCFDSGQLIGKLNLNNPTKEALLELYKNDEEE